MTQDAIGRLVQPSLGVILPCVEVHHEVRHQGVNNMTWIIITETIVPYYNPNQSHPSESIFVLSKDIRIILPALKKFRVHLSTIDKSEIKNRPWKIGSQIEKLLSDCSSHVHNYPCKSRCSAESLNHVADILNKVSSLRAVLDRMLCTAGSRGSIFHGKTIKLKRIAYLRTKLIPYFTGTCPDCQDRQTIHPHNHGSYVLRKAQWNNSCKTWVFQRIGDWTNDSGWKINTSELDNLRNDNDWQCLKGRPVTLPPYLDKCLQKACLTCPIDNDPRTESNWKNDSCRLCTTEKCSNIPLVYIKLTHPFALAVASLCVLGEIFVILVVIIFAKFRKTPVVKSSNRVFNFFTLSTLGVWFAVVPSFLGRANYLRCNTIVAAFLMLYATLSSILLSKTVRLLLIFKSMKQRSKWLGNVSFSLTTIAFILIQAFCCGINYLFYPLHPEILFRHDAVLLHCGRTSSPVTTLGFAYNCLLSGLCGYFAYKVRKLPQNFNEAKYMSFAIFSYTTSWLIVLTGYYDENCSAQQTTVVSGGLVVGALSVLACLFFPKVYTILFYPQLNTKSATLEATRRYSVEAAVSIGGIRPVRSRSSTLELQYTSRSRMDLAPPRDNQLGVPNTRPRTISDCSFSQLVGERSRQSSACSTETGSSDSPTGCGTISISVSGLTSPI